MAEENVQTILLPHVLIFPFPAQGHVNSMLTLAQLLARASESFFVTFLNSEHNHRRLLESSPNLFTQFSDVPRFRFRTIADGLQPDHRRSTDRLMDLIGSLDTKTRAEFTEMLADDRSRVCGSWPPISFLIVDGFLPCAMEVGRESGLPTFAFRTISPCSMWAYFCIPRLIEAGEIPIKDESDMDRLTRSIPGMDPDEGVQIRMRDLPSMYRTKDPTIDPAVTLLYHTTECSRHAHGLILNTLEEIETTTLHQFPPAGFPPLYTIGPLHALLTRSTGTDTNSLDQQQGWNTIKSHGSLWREDPSCMEWLDRQQSNSVIYVSFGSLAWVTRDPLIEFFHGLVDAGFPFLWVIRRDLMVRDNDGDGNLFYQEEGLLRSEAYEKCFLVDWAPQEKVLSHPSVGGFLTHTGWNSTLESLSCGVPMLCWPYFADQQINSRFVSHVWKVGIDMKDTCARDIIRRSVRELMNSEELRIAARKMKESIWTGVGEGGSSFCNFERLKNVIRALSAATTNSSQG